MMIQPVPSIFQVPDFFYYPSDNFPDFEYWFKQNITEAELSYWDRVYLPILFTSYFKRNQYGKNAAAIGLLQDFVDTLPADKKYFCIVQYDDGVLIDWKGKDVKVFSMSGKGDIPIPLVCQPHKFLFPGLKRDITISFVGRMTNIFREYIINWAYESKRKDIHVTSDPHSMEDYCRILARSKFVLCPRGYGASSFRISEAMQYGAMPIVFIDLHDKVYQCPISLIYTTEILGDFKFGDLIDYATRRSDGFTPGMENIYNRHYSFGGVKKTIFEALWNLL